MPAQKDPRAAPSIVILGTSKTGTTGVYTSVKRALRAAGVDALTVFEPKNARLLDQLFLHAAHQPLLIKTTMNSRAEVLPDPMVFDRRIMTSRDPRDMLISALLFRPLTKRTLLRCVPATIEQFVAALERKEADPASISVRELFDLSAELGIGDPPYFDLLEDLNRQRQLFAEHRFHVVRYEEFIRNELVNLSEYLGFTVQNVSDSSSPLFGHIGRSKTSGDFLHWFHPDDLTYFNDLFGEVIAAFGYERDVQLPEHQVVDPATSSGYVRSGHVERRGTLERLETERSTEWTPSSVDSKIALDALASAADDGDPVACLRLAQVTLNGHLGVPDETTALRWARRSAQLGNRDGVKLVIDLLERLPPDDASSRRELRVWRQERALRKQARVDRQQFQIGQRALEAETIRADRAEAELRRLRRSGGVRVGEQLLRLARAPRRDGVDAVRQLVSIWRGRHR